MKQICIITGGSAGLGLCLAKRLAAVGKNVAIIGRTQEKIEAVVQELRKLNPEGIVVGYSLDISDGEKVKSLYEELNRVYQVEYLFNVAGVGIFGEAKSIVEADVDAVLDANLKGMILMTTGALHRMEANGGKIINIISTAGLKGKSNEALYCASKWGARGFTEALKTEYKGKGIYIYGIYPGGMKTGFWNESPSFNTEKFMDPDQVAKQILEAVLSDSVYVGDLVMERM